MANLISIGQIIDKSWDHYVAHFKQLMMISMFALIVPALMILRNIINPYGEMQRVALMIENQLSSLSLLQSILGILIALIVVPVITVWIYIMLVKAVDSQSKNEIIALKELRALGWQKFLQYILVALIKTIVTLLPIIAIAPGIIMIFFNIYSDGGSLFGGAGIAITFIGLIIASVLIAILSVQLCFAGFANILKDEKGLKAIYNSRDIVKNRFWQTLWRLFVTKIVFSLVAGVMIIASIIITNLMVLGFYAIFSDAVSLLMVYSVNVFLTCAISILTTPIFIIADYYIYDSLNKTK